MPDLAHRRFVANQWTERAGHWLPPGSWQACAGQPDFTDGARLRGQRRFLRGAERR